MASRAAGRAAGRPAEGHSLMDQKSAPPRQRISTLGQIGLQQFAPYLMNRIMGRYNATLREELAQAAPDHPAGARAGRAVGHADGVPVNDLSVYTVIEQSTHEPHAGRAGGARPGAPRAGETDSRVRKVFLTDDGPRRVRPRLAVPCTTRSRRCSTASTTPNMRR